MASLSSRSVGSTTTSPPSSSGNRSDAEFSQVVRAYETSDQQRWTEIAGLRSLLDQVRKQYETHEAARTAEIAQLQSQLGVAKAQLQSQKAAQQQPSAVESGRSSSGLLRSLEARLAELEAENDRLRTASAPPLSPARVHSLLLTVAELRSANDSLARQLQRAEDQVKHALADRASMASQVEDARSQQAELQRHLMQLTADHAALKASMQTEQAKFEHVLELEKLRGEGVKTKVQELEQRLAAAEGRAAQLQSALQEVTAKLHATSEELTITKQDARRFQADGEQLMAAVKLVTKKHKQREHALKKSLAEERRRHAEAEAAAAAATLPAIEDISAANLPNFHSLDEAFDALRHANGVGIAPPATSAPPPPPPPPPPAPAALPATTSFAARIQPSLAALAGQPRPSHAVQSASPIKVTHRHHHHYYNSGSGSSSDDSDDSNHSSELPSTATSSTLSSLPPRRRAKQSTSASRHVCRHDTAKAAPSLSLLHQRLR